VSAAHQTFDVAKLERLNDPERFDTLMPDVMWRAIGSPCPTTIVEIGAGTGLFSAEFTHYAPGAVIHAVDTEPLMLQWMRDHRPEVAEGRIVPVLSTEERVPLADGVADVVVMINLHHELAVPDAIYSEAARILKPGGRLLVVDWAARETPRGPALHIRVTATALETFLMRAGFVDVDVTETELPWHVMATGTKPSM